MMSERKTRSATDHYLIGPEEPCIRAGTKLLTGKNVMQYLMFRKSLPEYKSTVSVRLRGPKDVMGWDLVLLQQ